jgi:glycosyltransferase involved in cell wall biosynthesis
LGLRAGSDGPGSAGACRPSAQAGVCRQLRTRPLDIVLDLVVDGVIFQYQARGGVSRIYSEILPRMCEQDPSLRIALLLKERRAPRQALPVHPAISYVSVPHVDPYLRPARVWGNNAAKVRRLVDRLWIGNGAGKIWHSTYFTQMSGWRGAQVVTVVDMIYERYRSLFNEPYDQHFREQKRRAVSSAAAVICISETTRRDVQDYYGVPADKTFVVPLAHSDSFYPLETVDEASRPQKPFLLYVGKRTQYKNFDLLLEAFGSWRSRTDVDLVVVTDSEWSTDEQRSLAKFGLDSRVKLLIDIDDEQLRRLYGQAVAFVYPSLYEGFGIPLLEAMACGCTVVASDIPSSREVAADCPLYFDPTSAEDLRTALDKALQEIGNQERRTAAMERAATFSWNNTALQTLEIYRSVKTGIDMRRPQRKVASK